MIPFTKASENKLKKERKTRNQYNQQQILITIIEK
jgi:hypothetical protein